MVKIETLKGYFLMRGTICQSFNFLLITDSLEHFKDYGGRDFAGQPFSNVGAIILTFFAN